MEKLPQQEHSNNENQPAKAEQPNHSQSTTGKETSTCQQTITSTSTHSQHLTEKQRVEMEQQRFMEQLQALEDADINDGRVNTNDAVDDENLSKNLLKQNDHAPHPPPIPRNGNKITNGRCTSRFRVAKGAAGQPTNLKRLCDLSAIPQKGFMNQPFLLVSL